MYYRHQYPNLATFKTYNLHDVSHLIQDSLCSGSRDHYHSGSHDRYHNRSHDRYHRSHDRYHRSHDHYHNRSHNHHGGIYTGVFQDFHVGPLVFLGVVLVDEPAVSAHKDKSVCEDGGPGGRPRTRTRQRADTAPLLAHHVISVQWQNYTKTITEVKDKAI